MGVTVVGGELLPVKKTSIGSVILDGLEYFPATVLAKMNLAGLAGSRVGIYNMADREGWSYITAPGRGKKDGVRYYRVPDYVHVLIDGWREGKNLAFDTVFGNTSIEDTVSSDSEHNGLTATRADVKVAYVERYKGVNGAAGGGQVAPLDFLIEQVKFNPQDLRLGVPVKYLKIITVKGSSMEPLINDGDEIFIDTRCDRFDDNAIYAIQQGDLTRIKRIQLRLDGSIEVKSDNDGWTTEIYSAEEATSFRVIGKVTPWKFGRFKL